MDFEFMFYVDLEASVYADEIVSLIASLDRSPEQAAGQSASEHFAFLGSYSEI
jgi:chorismate mutase/prephenate dehydratase